MAVLSSPFLILTCIVRFYESDFINLYYQESMTTKYCNNAFNMY